MKQHPNRVPLHFLAILLLSVLLAIPVIITSCSTNSSHEGRLIPGNTNIQGRIIDEEGNPIPEAQITIKKDSPQKTSSNTSEASQNLNENTQNTIFTPKTVTNTEGWFSLENIPEGAYIILIEKQGYQTLSLSYTIGTNEVNLYLEIITPTGTGTIQGKIITPPTLNEPIISDNLTVDLTWNSNDSTPFEGYKVSRSTSPNVKSTDTITPVLPPKTTTCRDTLPLRDKVFYYRVYQQVNFNDSATLLVGSNTVNTSTVPPADITSSSPRTAGTETNTAISITFSNPMKKESVESAFSLTSDYPDDNLSGTFTWSENTLTFKPDKNLGYSRTITVNLNNAQALGGNYISISWQFTTKHPGTLQLSPQGPNISPSPIPEITAEFPVPMQEESFTGAFSITPDIQGTTAWNQEENRFTFTPDTIDIAQEYEVELTGIRDASGNLYPRNPTWTFSTLPTWLTIGSTITDNAKYTSLFIADGTPYLAYRNNTTGTITVLKLENNTWTPVGDTSSMTAHTNAFTSLFIENGTIYCAYFNTDGGYSSAGKPIVKKYTEGTWQDVGTGGPVLDAYCDSLSLFVYQSIPYITFDYYNSPYSLLLFSNPDGTWHELAREGDGITNGGYNTSLYVHNGIPYVAYVEYPSPSRVHVKKFDTTWQEVGTGGGLTTAYYSHNNSISLIFHNNTPHVAYSDTTDGYLVVKKLQDNTWTDILPDPYLTDYAIKDPRLASEGDTLYIACRTSAIPYKSRVFTCKNETLTDLSTPDDIADNSYEYQSLTVHNKEPYLASVNINTGKPIVKKYGIKPSR